MKRTCNQLGYCLNAERAVCPAHCEHPDAIIDDEQTTLERIITVASWVSIGVISLAVVGVVAAFVYGFGYSFLTRIG